MNDDPFAKLQRILNDEFQCAVFRAQCPEFFELVENALSQRKIQERQLAMQQQLVMAEMKARMQAQKAQQAQQEADKRAWWQQERDRHAVVNRDSFKAWKDWGKDPF